MSELMFEPDVRWKGTGRDGAGTVTTGGQEITHSAPSMGGRGSGTSPEELLISAAGSCYAGTLFHPIARDALPATDVVIRVQGVVTDYPSREEAFSWLIVHPRIDGADPSRIPAYEACARKAGEHCFIGKTLREAISYEVGDVEVRLPTPVSVEAR
jgi:organic hydroperoxide reductase OsmC/OhrA